MIGIILIIFSAIVTAIGIFLQKIGLKKVKKWKDVIKSYKWMLGYSLFIPGFIFYILALKYERLSIIQPISNFSIIVLVILETIFLNEKIKKHEIFALFLFFTGIILTGL
jgi:drug/metabolite transporter (DMT)-like permease